MREGETFTFEGIPEPPHNSSFIWRDAVRHQNAVRLLVRQLAFKETGEHATFIEITAHLDEHQARLTVEAEKLIATSSSFADWRLPRGEIKSEECLTKKS
jgi:hypothetical protein